MKVFVVCCAALAQWMLSFLRSSAQAPQSETTRRVDPAFDAIVSPGATVETLKDGFGFINGILWVKESGGGHLLISDIPANVVQRWTPDGKMSPFLEKPDWTRTTGRPAEPEIRRQRHCASIRKAGSSMRQKRIAPSCGWRKTGRGRFWPKRYEGKRLNSPNDLVFRSDGALYFTDPSGGNRFADWDLKKELPYQGVFLLKDGKLQLLIKDLDRPNGIALSPDEKFLYVNDSAKRTITALRGATRWQRCQWQAVRGHERRNGHRQSRRDEVRCQRESLLGGSRWHLGVLARRQASGHDRPSRIRARLHVR